MRTSRILLALLVPLTALAAGSSLSAEPGLAAHAKLPPPGGFEQQLLAAHNRERDHAGVPRLSWSDDLRRAAKRWADELAREGRMRHASYGERGGAGENLWMGTAGFYDAETMVGSFAAEKRNYLSGRFPEVSRTGRWEDVGHYTQLVWRGTREVGCAISRGERNEFLVCRYWPAGNWVGQQPF